MVKLRKKDRQLQLKEKLNTTPFITDEELADFFHVSVPTIRLDRLELGIPELRERIKEVAREHANEYGDLNRSASIGELLDVTVGVQGISLLVTTEEMTDDNGVVEPQYLYAQANSLAKAVMGNPVSLTGVGNIKYKNAVCVGRKLIAKAEVIRVRGEKTFIWIFTKDKNKEVFRAKFIMETIS